jgi:hypothetical protein
MSDFADLNASGYRGRRDDTSDTSSFNALSFLVRQILNRISTATVVRVVAVTNAGGLSPVGFVDVLPLVNQVTGGSVAVPHAVVHHLPYFRLQGGSDAIILDAKVGDLGLAIFADHDISSVKVTRAQANPGSRRRFSKADGLYVGGFLNGTPSQFVQFTDTGITITSPGRVTINAPTITLNGDVAAIGAFTSNGVDISSTHVHGGVSVGGADTGVPI